MNDRERALAVLNYQSYDHLPIVHFGYWNETLDKWVEEGHLKAEEARQWWDGSPVDPVIGQKLGFDFNWYSVFSPNTWLHPPIERKVLEEYPDGSRKVVNGEGVVIIEKTGVVSIPMEVDHLFKDRQSWETIFKERLQWASDRLTNAWVSVNGKLLRFDQGGLEATKEPRQLPLGLHCGSLYGNIRNMVGMVELNYLIADDRPLVEEMVEAVGELCYQATKAALESGAQFDFAHYWEDICFKSGPLVNPRFFNSVVGPQYKRINDLVHSYGINIISLDCDGKIDALIPTWFNNGVNTMFPMEVGTWGANIAPWREKYGRELRGVGGMNKVAFAYDYAAIDAEIERLKPLVELGGYIPCPDHRIAPDAKWENVQYYCDKMRKTFGC
jgi:hypothetical protein